MCGKILTGETDQARGKESELISKMRKLFHTNVPMKFGITRWQD